MYVCIRDENNTCKIASTYMYFHSLFKAPHCLVSYIHPEKSCKIYQMHIIKENEIAGVVNLFHINKLVADKLPNVRD